jgi:ribosomal protein L29
MKKKDLKELRKKPVSALQKNIADEYEKLNNLQFSLSAGKVKNIKEIKNRKKNIAKIKTILKEKLTN